MSILAANQTRTIAVAQAAVEVAVYLETWPDETRDVACGLMLFKLAALGYDGPFRALDNAIADYVAPGCSEAADALPEAVVEACEAVAHVGASPTELRALASALLAEAFG